jgi:8-oxo-dGTP diphosphatase
MKLATLCYIIDREKNVTLMLLRNKKENDFHEGKWNGLGGKFEPHETPEECVIREVEEESGLKISSPHLKGLITFPLFDGKDDWYVFLYTADKFEGDLINSNEGHLEWIPNDKILSLNLWEGDQIFIPWVLDGKFFSAKFDYDNKKLKNFSVNFY